MLTLFLNDLAREVHPGLPVLEDYHTITSPRVHETLAFLLEHLPATLHVVLIARSDPSLPLARFRACHTLCKLRTADIRFSPQETRQFLQESIVAI